MVGLVLSLAAMGSLESKPDLPCSTNMDLVVRTSSARTMGLVDPSTLTSRCISVTRAAVLHRWGNGFNNAPNLEMDFVIDAELKFGVERYAHHDRKSGETYFKNAIHDHYLKYYNPVYSRAASIIPNPGLRLMATHRIAAGFAWYLDKGPRWEIDRDVDVEDSKYYDNLISGFSDGSKGDYRHALQRFQRCVARFPTGSDCFLFEGVAYHALGDDSHARAAWAASIKSQVTNGGLPPQYGQDYGVSSAYLWLRLLQHVTVT